MSPRAPYVNRFQVIREFETPCRRKPHPCFWSVAGCFFDADRTSLITEESVTVEPEVAQLSPASLIVDNIIRMVSGRSCARQKEGTFLDYSKSAMQGRGKDKRNDSRRL